ncbi:MAG: hypothetical protein IPK66_12250 [Rhodospirillales bacterium]|nr:hypothetical protein [Rhodospirillales bacterium]
MTVGSSHRLEGLEPDNLLAFLALLGLLRALEIARPEWCPRAYWDLQNAPIRPVLTTGHQTTYEEIGIAALNGLAILRKALWPFSWPRSKDGSAKKTALFSKASRQQALAKRCVLAANRCRLGAADHLVWQLRCDLISASGAGVRDRKNPKKKNSYITPLKLPSGQMTFIGAQYDLLGKCKEHDIIKCLFNTWSYDYKGNSLRFSPDEARRYAYRGADPSPEGSRTELGASALGSFGLLAFTICERVDSWEMIAYRGTRSEGSIIIPIWGDNAGSGTSRHGIDAMLRAIEHESRGKYSACNFSTMLSTARRYVLDPTQGDYGNISRALLSRLDHE